MALLPPETSTDNCPALERSNDAPRRSGRLQDKDPQTVESQKASRRAKKGSMQAKFAQLMGDDKAEALNKLQEMEKHLRDDLRKQKMAIKESEVQSNNLQERYAGLMPRLTKSQPDVLSPSKERKWMGEEPDSRGIPSIDDSEGGAEALAHEGEDGAPDEVDEADVNVMKQEGARPPPVNSEYLPLPWKGRLGYVNNSRHTVWPITTNETRMTDFAPAIGMP